MTTTGSGAGNTIPPTTSGPSVGGIYATAGTLVFTTQVVADTNARFALTADGGMAWGPGNAAADTSLARLSAGVLRANSGANLVDIGATGNGPGLIFHAAADTAVYRENATSDLVLAGSANIRANRNFQARGTAATQVTIGNVGPGTEAGIIFGLAGDTNQYRSAADTLKTDDDYRVGANIKLEAASAAIYGQYLQRMSGGVAQNEFIQFAANAISINKANLVMVDAAFRFQWGNAGQVQATVGAAGVAAAPPATPETWLKVLDPSGNERVIPAYLPA